MINTNPSVAVDEQPIEKEEEKTTHHFFSRDTLKKSPDEFTQSTYENDDITPFYVLGYN